MDRAAAERVSAELAALIARSALRVSESEAEIAAARQAYSIEELRQFREAGLLGDDFGLFYAMKRLCDAAGLWRRADLEYLRALFGAARRLDARAFRQNPYIRAVNVRDMRVGRFLLTGAEYARGEFLQYDFPDLGEGPVIPKIGFFPEAVRFPCVYEDRMPWMSVCPSEINTMAQPIRLARGRVLALGLGLGYFPFMASLSPEVRDITVVERQPEVIRIFRERLMPYFPRPDALRIVQADALDFLAHAVPGDYDFCFADIWEGVQDGMAAYLRVRDLSRRFPSTEFACWIEGPIREYIRRLAGEA